MYHNSRNTRSVGTKRHFRRLLRTRRDQFISARGGGVEILFRFRIEPRRNQMWFRGEAGRVFRFGKFLTVRRNFIALEKQISVTGRKRTRALFPLHISRLAASGVCNTHAPYRYRSRCTSYDRILVVRSRLHSTSCCGGGGDSTRPHCFFFRAAIKVLSGEKKFG